MGKLKKQMWAKGIALILAVITGLAMVGFTVLAMLVGIVPQLQGGEKAYMEAVYTPLLSSYAALLWDGMDFSEEGQAAGLDALDGGNLRYVVQRQTGSYFEDLTDEGFETLYANDTSLTAENAIYSDIFESGDNVPRYNLSSFAWAMRGGHYLSYDREGTWWMTAEVDQVLYDEDDGLFYFTGNSRYLLVPYFAVEHREGGESPILRQEYEIHMRDGILAYYEAGSEEPLTVQQVKEWAAEGNSTLSFGEWDAVFGTAEDASKAEGNQTPEDAGENPPADEDGETPETAGPEEVPKTAGPDVQGEAPEDVEPDVQEPSTELDGAVDDGNMDGTAPVQVWIGSWELPQSQIYGTLLWGLPGVWISMSRRRRSARSTVFFLPRATSRRRG